jgi:nucleotide-binding universal stress UspA family protein
MSGSFHPADRIVMPVQGTDREFIAQQWAVEFAAALGVPVCALHVTTSEKVPTSGVFSFLEKTCSKWGVVLEKHILQGEDVVGELVEEIKTRDLVIIGTRRLAGHYHLGSVSLDLIRRAPCPVQVVRIE